MGTLLVLLTLGNVILGFYTFRNTRTKDSQQQLFDLKIAGYNALRDACHDLVKRLDISQAPFSEIYNYLEKDKWVEYCETHLGNEIIAGFALQNVIEKHALYLPEKVSEEFMAFSFECIGFVKNVYHFDTQLTIKNQD